MPYQWAGAHAYRDNASSRVIEPGERLPADVAERIAEAHPHDVATVDERDTTESPLDPDEHTVTELRDVLAGSDYTDEQLAALKTAEQAGKGRTTAVKAITAATHE